MAEEHFVVIGNGPAGNEAARTLREKVPGARITQFSRGREPCYRRRLLPDLIAGKIQEQALYMSAFSDYKDNEIKLRCCQEVALLDVERRQLIMDHKEVVPFTGLILAVGGRPRIPEPLEAFGDLMLTLKTLDDARLWRQRLTQSGSVLIIGGDLTSFAVTRALLHLDKKVHFMLDEGAFWPLRPDEALFKEVGQRLSEKGVEVLKSRSIRGMKRAPDGKIQVEADDRELEVDLIGAFFGLVPDIQFLGHSGLTMDRGILVDEYLNTGFEGIYATGDCAQIYHPEIHDYWVSIGHDNAVALGRIAALNLAGGRVQAEVSEESIYEVQGIRVNTSWWMDY
jgi:nitrite reductase (NADH) large subunit